MRGTGDDPDGLRLRALIVVFWRAGLRISEALALTESDLDPGHGAVLVRRGKSGKRRDVGMDRVQLRDAAVKAGVRRRFAPHQLRHAHAVEMSREGVPLVVIQRQLGPRPGYAFSRG
jgi:site-specific recombinase XerD